MRLQRLIVQGFKSFKDRTTIEFDDGITGIVGPNGCGKSNIVDALFWVMGEQSAKHLRGSQMKDLIFSGSSKYSPASFAEVTLVLENSNGKHIHINGQVVKPVEIQLTRKLYRNGETEYKINGEQARLKDIQEVFMDTGAGAKSYSIIAQGEINKLVQAKPEERRVMIEEVAGITKFKLRKRDSLKKIEQTQQNLSRLEDLGTEIYKNLKSLEKQAEKAERARTLKERIKKYELSVDSHKEVAFLQDYINAQQILENRKTEVQSLVNEKNEIESGLEDEKNQKSDLVSKIEEQQSEFNLLSREHATLQEKVKHLKKSLIDKNQQIESKLKENDEIAVDLQDRQNRLETLKKEEENLLRHDYSNVDFAEQEEKVDLLKNKLVDSEDILSAKRKEFQDKKNEIQDQDNQLFKIGSKIEEYSRLLQDLNLEIETIEKSTTTQKDDLIKERERYKTAHLKLQKIEEEMLMLRSSLEETEAKYQAQQKSVHHAQKELLQHELKLSSLLEISSQTEGLRSQAENIISNYPDKLAILGDLVECPEEFRSVVQTALEDFLDGVFLSSTESPTFLSKLNQVSYNVLVPQNHYASAEFIERLSVKGFAGITALNEVAKCVKPEFNESFKNWTNGIYIVDSINSSMAEQLNFEMNFRAIISKDARFFVKKTGHGLIWGSREADLQQGMGIVERTNLMRELEIKIQQDKEDVQNFSAEFLKIENNLQELKEIHNKTLKQKEVVSIEVATLNASLEAKEKADNSSSTRLDLLLKRRDETSIARLSLIEEDEKIKAHQKKYDSVLKSFESEIEEMESLYQDLKISYENEREELSEIKVKAQSYQAQLNGVTSQILDIENVLERYEAKLKMNKDSIALLEAEIVALDEEVSTLDENNQSMAIDLSGKEEFLSLVKDQLAQLLSSMQEKDSKVREISSRLNKIEKENIEVELKVGQIFQEEELLVRNIFEKYQVNLRKVAQEYLVFEEEQLVGLKDITALFQTLNEEGEFIAIEPVSYIFDKKFPGEIKEQKEKLKEYKSEFNRLGEINWQAIEDYDRQKLRYDFLKSQEEELKKSLVDLQTAIGHIDLKSRERFKEAFTEVNQRFSKVFPIIFGGGSAELQIVGDLDSADCGVDIIAQPPGKKMQSIQLMSGGEKAMTAVSLIFSIFLVKPSPFCLLDEVDAPLDDANVGRFNELLREMSTETQFILITHNKKTMELNDTLYGVTMQEPGVSNAVSVQLH